MPPDLKAIRSRFPALQREAVFIDNPGGTQVAQPDIVKELCHLVHPNHHKGFYRLMRQTMPDWQARKKKLEVFGVK